MDERRPAITGNDTPVLPLPNIPIVRPMAWHTLPPYGAAGSANVPSGRLFALPFWTGRRAMLVGGAVNVTLALLGGNVRMGLYTCAQGHPSMLIKDFGTVGTGILGVQQLTGFRVMVDPRLHFFAVARQGGVLNLGLSSRDSWDPIVSDTAPVLASNLNAYYRDGVAGALPEEFGPVAGSIQGPSASVQLT